MRDRRSGALRPGSDGDAIFAGDILKQGLQIDFLLILAADRRRGGLSNNRNDRLMIHFGVIQSIEQMDAPGPLVAMQTPTVPVNFAWAVAMKAASSSCRA